MNDGIRTEWKANPKQAEFLRVPFTIREALYGGGAGSGKTDLLLMFGIVHQFYKNPSFKQVFLRRTFPELRNEVVPRAKQLYRPFGGKFNATNMSFEFPSGAMIFLGHCETLEDVHKYDSMEINLFTPDEITSLLEDMYMYIAFTRVRSAKHTGLPSIIRAAGMPGGIGHSFVKKRFVDPAPQGGVVLSGKGGNKRIYIHSTQADNAEYIDPNYKVSLEALPEAEKKAKLHGDWDAFLGQVFEEFRAERFEDEVEQFPNAIHVIDDFEIPTYWPRIIGIDWGYRPPAMTWVGFAAISPEKRVYIYRELAYQKVRIEDWCADVKFWIEKEKPKTIVLCRSAGQDRGQEHTIHQQVESGLGNAVNLTSNQPGTRKAGKMLLHEYLRFQQKPRHKHDPELPYDESYAQWILRNKPHYEYMAYLAQYEDMPGETNLPKLQIFRECKHLIQAIQSCIYDKTDPEDVAEFPGDDPYDGLRYIIDIADRYFLESEKEFLEVKERELLEARLKQSGDMTAYYMQARRMDEKKRNVSGSIKRYRHH